MNGENIMTIASRLAGVCVAAVMLAGCGGGGDSAAKEPASSAAASDTPTPTPTPTPSPTLSKAPQVSETTTCNLLFSGKGKGPLETIVDFISRPSNSVAQAAAMDDAIDSLRGIAASASDHLAGQLTAEADAAQQILDGARAGDDTAYDSTPLKAAGLEIANTCQQLL